MPAYVVKKILANTKEDERALINQFLNYPDNSAGSLMTIEYVDLQEGYDCGQRQFSILRETGIREGDYIYLLCYRWHVGSLRVLYP
ncbi:MAG: hypothetical protein KatS3mg079_229 [Caloramator sp.]|nr:MAG: hypothetical protein KatS3mg079_229 [Caloramator sp.]